MVVVQNVSKSNVIMCFEIPVSSQDSGLGGSNDIILCTLNASDQSSSKFCSISLALFRSYSSELLINSLYFISIFYFYFLFIFFSTVTSLHQTEFPGLVLD